MLLLLAIVSSCKKSKETEKIPTLPETREIKIPDSADTSTTTHQQEREFGKRAFDIIPDSAFYTKNGTYSLKLKIPYITRGKEYLEPKIEKRIDISTCNEYIILFLAQHKKKNRESLRAETIPLKTIIDKGKITNIIKGFKPKEGKTIHAIVLHDEDYFNHTTSQSDKKMLKTCLQETALDPKYKIPANCVTTIFYKSVEANVHPRTIGNGGVIPPK